MQAHLWVVGPAAITKAALDGGRAMGLTAAQILAVIAGLNRACFYKSMTTFRDDRVWQDVYHAPTPNNRIAYIKLTFQPPMKTVIQFKER